MSLIKNILPVATLLVALLSSLPAMADSLTIRIQNMSGVTLYRLHATPRSFPDYDQDLLGNRVLNDRSIMPLTFENVQECLYDFRFEFIEGSVIYDAVDLCTVGTYTIMP
ncbi:hypothetical protein [Pseudoroseicyclus tamaricis]|uniref:Uncharacterized protein n=1 Tax=Pseudoroseicyclus tamaricis TaxID=2705421 RepID=A0A6B2K218_9RHOB|nr:hypothetical protein [Pseudoroseicyclus tamaricis]NDV02564.1 hypothetical protein [Pseudoroseicyclus tamaricis]